MSICSSSRNKPQSSVHQASILSLSFPLSVYFFCGRVSLSCSGLKHQPFPPLPPKYLRLQHSATVHHLKLFLLEWKVLQSLKELQDGLKFYLCAFYRKSYFMVLWGEAGVLSGCMLLTWACHVKDPNSSDDGNGDKAFSWSGWEERPGLPLVRVFLNGWLYIMPMYAETIKDNSRMTEAWDCFPTKAS